MSNELTVSNAVNWLIHNCTTPGCTVTIRVPVGEQHKHGLCKWCDQRRAYNTRDPTRTYASTGPLLSLDEFGVDLFEAIKAQAGSIQAFKKAETYRTKGLREEADQAEREAIVCQSTLESILKKNTIAVDNVRRILAMQ